MKRSLLFAAGCLLAGAVHAEDGFTVGIGADYSTGDYGTDTTTEIWSVPLTARFDSGDWRFKASLPWLRVSGDPNVLPGLGNVANLNPRGRGRGGLVGPPPPDAETASGTASGVGDLTLEVSRSFDTGGPLGIDVTGKAKIATADEDKGLGTGANDYGLAIDLYRAYGATTVFGGAGYTMLGDSDFIDVDAVANANVGFSRKVGAGNLGLLYDWREAASTGFDDRSEITGFYGVDAGASGRVQFHATRGLSDGSPEWGAGVSYSHGF
ncbi:MAG TPA: transporter [Xanthomonadaceae bacterium]|nr:transporter [Xanthomonadaceae bacterium]